MSTDARAALHAERAVLGAILRDSSAHADAAALIRGADFSSPHLGAAFDGIGEMIAAGEAVDEMAIEASIPNWNAPGLDAVEVWSWRSLATHRGEAFSGARAILDGAQRRRLLALSQQGMRESQDASVRPSDALRRMHAALESEQLSEPTPAHTRMGDLIREAAAGTIAKPSPTIGRIADRGAGIFYAAKVNGLAGDSGVGKSWIALRAALDEAEAGRSTVWWDFEDSPQTLAQRMAEIGWPAHLGDRMIHVDALSGGEAELLRIVREVRPGLVVTDSLGEALASVGANGNDDGDVGQWMQRVARAACRLGPGVILLDHLTKADGGLWAGGSHRKRAAISGIQLIAKSLKPFSRDRAGRVGLIVAKDRGGHHTQGETVAEVAFDPTATGLHVAFWGGTREQLAPDGLWRPTGLMAQVSAFLEQHPAASKTAIEQSKALTAKSAHIRRALEVLVQEGFVSTEAGPRNAVLHTSIKPFSEADDA